MIASAHSSSASLSADQEGVAIQTTAIHTNKPSRRRTGIALICTHTAKVMKLSQ